MIRIQLTDKTNYFQLRKEYLERIYSYIGFDKADIFPDAGPDNFEKTLNTADKLKKFFPELYRFLFNEDSSVNRMNLRFLLIGPDDLPQSFGGKSKIKKMQDCFEEIVAKIPLPREKKARKNAKDCCKEIFQYQKFVANKNDAYWLLRTLDVRVCPYCNRIYTVTLPSKEELEKDELFKATRSTFDHFYSQDKFPYLALSLFNLIPSCFSCNLNKRDLDRKIVYPYDEEFGKNAVFRVIPQKKYFDYGDPFDYLHGESDDFTIKFIGNGGSSLQSDILLKDRLSYIEDTNLRERVQGTIEVFNLEELYEEHKTEIKDILKTRFYFSKEYVRAEICPMIRKKMLAEGKEEVDLDVLEEMAMDFLFFTRTKVEGWGKRPLSKLISDILEQISG